MRTKKKAKHHHPDLELMKTVKPGNNFYKYVNGVWADSSHLLPTQHTTGVSQDMQNIADDCLLNSINKLKYHKGHLSEKEKRDNLLLCLKESIKEFPHSANNLASLQQKVSEIQCLRSKEEIVGYIGKLNAIGCPSMLFLLDTEDPINTRKVFWSFFMGDFSLGDSEFYNNPNYGTPRFWKLYREYIDDLERIWRLPGSLSDIPNLENQFNKHCKIAFSHESKKKKRYLFSVEELENKFKCFPWQSFFEGIGLYSYSEWRHKKIVLRSRSIIKVFCEYLKKIDLPTWKNWLTLLVLNHGIQFTTPEMSERWHQLFQKEISALPKRKTGNDFFLSVAKVYAPIPLNDLYRDTCFSRRKKNALKPFFRSLLTAAVEQIDSADWMNLSTREHAKRKVRTMGVGIGYPEGSYHYSFPELSPNHLLENIYALNFSSLKSKADRIADPVLRQIWTKPIFNVNAHYSENMNRIIFPAAILEEPFYVEGGSIGWNYGGLGATIGHEITHAFDRDGMLVDEHGKKDEWYSAQDKKEYDRRAEALINIFDNLKEQGERLDAPYIISEAIADLGGLGIALHALQKELLEKGAGAEETEKEIRLFFISYAYSWRIKMRPKQALRKVYIDEHPPAWTRVNYIVQHFQEFHDIFGVTSGQELYLEPKKRIRFF
jgi:predicted metalloendopeptidase